MDMVFAVCAYSDRLLIEVIIMNNYLLITHGFNEFQIQEIVRKMADLRDAKTGLYSETEMRAKLHYAIEYMSDSDSDRIENIGDLFPIYLKMGNRIRPTYLHNRSKQGVKSDINDSKQMTLDLWDGANDE